MNFLFLIPYAINCSHKSTLSPAPDLKDKHEKYLTFGVFRHTSSSALVKLKAVLAVTGVVISPNCLTFAVISASGEVEYFSMRLYILGNTKIIIENKDEIRYYPDYFVWCLVDEALSFL